VTSGMLVIWSFYPYAMFGWVWPECGLLYELSVVCDT